MDRPTAQHLRPPKATTQSRNRHSAKEGTEWTAVRSERPMIARAPGAKAVRDRRRDRGRRRLRRAHRRCAASIGRTVSTASAAFRHMMGGSRYSRATSVHSETSRTGWQRNHVRTVSSTRNFARRRLRLLSMHDSAYTYTLCTTAPTPTLYIHAMHAYSISIYLLYARCMPKTAVRASANFVACRLPTGACALHHRIKLTRGTFRVSQQQHTARAARSSRAAAPAWSRRAMRNRV